MASTMGYARSPLVGAEVLVGLRAALAVKLIWRHGVHWPNQTLPARSFGIQIRGRVRLIKFESLVCGGSLDEHKKPVGN